MKSNNWTSGRGECCCFGVVRAVCVQLNTPEDGGRVCDQDLRASDAASGRATDRLVAGIQPGELLSSPRLHALPQSEPLVHEHQ